MIDLNLETLLFHFESLASEWINHYNPNNILYLIEKYFCLDPIAVMLAQGYNWSKWAQLQSNRNTKIWFTDSEKRDLKSLNLWAKYTKWETNIFKLVLALYGMIYFPIYIGWLVGKSRFQFPLLQYYNLTSQLARNQIP